jgi:hypothetical protein
VSHSTDDAAAEELHPLHAGFRRQIIEAAGIDPAELSVQGRRILNWLSRWDDWTTEGVVEILAATRATGRQEIRR